MALTKVTSGLISADASSVDLNIDAGTLYIDATNNRVGIGTTSPANTLHVVDSDSSQASFLRNATGGSAGGITIGNNTTTHTLGSSSNGFTIYEGATERMRIDSSGNVGIGTTPSGWASTWLPVQIGVGSSFAGRTDTYVNTNIVTNGYYDGTNWKYLSTNVASKYYQLSGAHIFDYAASGSVGANITWNEAMRIDSSGNLLSGTSTSKGSRLQVSSAGVSAPTLGSSTNTGLLITNTDVTYGMNFGTINNGNGWIQQHSNTGTATAYNLLLQPVGGNVGIGTSSPSSYYSNNLVVSCPSEGGITLASTTTSQGNNICFADGTTGTDRYDGYIAYVHGASPVMKFGVNGGTERMRIDSSGTLLVGTTSAIYSGGTSKLELHGSGLYQVFRHTSSTAGHNMRIEVDSNPTFYVLNHNSTGVYLASGNTSWASLSDETLKENITDIGSVLDKVKNYRTARFNWTNDPDSNSKIGFIAQDWQTDFPEVITEGKDNKLGMNYTETIPVLLKAIQEQQTLIEQLQAEVALLKGE